MSASFDAPRSSLIDCRLGEFEKRGLDDRVIAAFGDPRNHPQQVVVRWGVPAAMRDQEDRGDRFVRVYLARVLVHPQIISGGTRSAR